jgi:hypothetical protein
LLWKNISIAIIGLLEFEFGNKNRFLFYHRSTLNSSLPSSSASPSLSILYASVILRSTPYFENVLTLGHFWLGHLTCLRPGFAFFGPWLSNAVHQRDRDCLQSDQRLSYSYSAYTDISISAENENWNSGTESMPEVFRTWRQQFICFL